MQEKTRKKRGWLILLGILLVLAVAILIYSGIYYHADKTAEIAIQGDSVVHVSKADYGWFFDGPGEKDALIFYPGGKVEETAYAPLLAELARQGMDVCLVKMPMHLAVLGPYRADQVMEEYLYEHWYIGGHSLGGAVAAIYASEHAEELDGLILLAAYSTHPWDEKTAVLLTYGSEDQVLDKEKYEECLENLPEGAKETVIQGGNHAQFGSYGEQKGDGRATISPEEQIRETVQAILELIR